MAGSLEDSIPRYLSARSSDVILSDIRPIKLKPEALRAINALLDELLWNILNAAKSLSTDQLKASFLKILPTSLGKEALLEAEVELKAYWERTNPSSNLSGAASESDDFPLQWAYELMQLKCEAYSTLNDSDEDVGADSRLSERMKDRGFMIPPPMELVAPAALYLTAIIEFICEHILSKISRVVTRDSSRNSATPHDLFTALCEDVTVYNTFKLMKVYQHIDQLQKAPPKPRRSKSFSRDKVAITSRTSSQHSESTREAHSPRVRMSAESLNSANNAGYSSRTSLERARTKLFGHNRRDSSDLAPETPLSATHRRTESGLSESANGSLDLEDQVLRDEFDELMRSGATMKVSLTPDRLKSMEVYNKEKNKRSTKRSTTKRPVVNGVAQDEPPLPSLDTKRTQRTLRHVDSIIEDEEEHNQHHSASLDAKTLSSTPSSQKNGFSSQSDSNGRLRSMSTSQASPSAPKLLRKSSWASSKVRTPTQSPVPAMPPPSADATGRPPRTRKPQRNLQDIDLDDVMNGSDEEDPAPPSSYRGPSSRTAGGAKISASARELIDFLSEGPPEEPQYLSPVPPNVSKSSRGGRLGRMMHKLTGGPSTERLREDPPALRKAASFSAAGPNVKGGLPQPVSYAQNSIGVAKGYNGTGVIVGTPPRPPRPATNLLPNTPPSPPQSPQSPTRESFDAGLGTPATPQVPLIRKPVSPANTPKVDQTRLAPPSRGSTRQSPLNASKESLASSTSTHNNGRSNGHSNKPQPSQSSAETDLGSIMPVEKVKHLRRLLGNATTADECRVLVDMFFARVGLPLSKLGDEPSYPTPVSDGEDTEMEGSLVEVMLNGGGVAPRSPSISSRSEEYMEAQTSPQDLIVVAPPRAESLRAQTPLSHDTQPQYQVVAQTVSVA